MLGNMALRRAAHIAHIILFFRGKYPELPLNKMYEWDKYWPHGHIKAQQPDYGGFKYVVKYLLKDNQRSQHYHLAMSKKPPLGDEYFDTLATHYARRGFVPENHIYTPFNFMINEALIAIEQSVWA